MQKKYITTFWQSLDLLQAGMNRDTADYYYDGDKNAHYLDGTAITDHAGPATDVPAWSMGRLWDFCLENGWTYEFATNLTSTEVIQKLVEGIIKKLKK